MIMMIHSHLKHLGKIIALLPVLVIQSPKGSHQIHPHFLQLEILSMSLKKGKTVHEALYDKLRALTKVLRSTFEIDSCEQQCDIINGL